MTLRQWHLTSAHPFVSVLAADPRLVSIDPKDNQVWDLTFGDGDNPALSLQTRYGGRAGLVSLTPMWTLEGRPKYLTSDYAEPPFIRHFAPGYFAVEAGLTSTLRCVYEFWARDSHSVSGRVSIQNTGDTAVNFRLDIVGFVALRGHEGKVQPAALTDGTMFLSLGTIGDLQPAVALDHPEPFTLTSRGRMGADMTLEAGADAAIRFGCAGLPMIQESGGIADAAAKVNWDNITAKIERLAANTPTIETGDIEADAAIAFSYQTAILAPDPALKPENAPDVYLLATALAPVDPERAKRLVRAAVDAQANATPDKLWMPILARLAYAVYDQTKDQDFLRELLPKLEAFFNRWRTECDLDKDGIPEWQADGQNAFPFAPTFALSDPRGQHADIRTVESPDLAAYMLSEARFLHAIARDVLNDGDMQTYLEPIIEMLKSALLSLWRDDLNRAAYRDRDSHETSTSVSVLQDARASEEQFIALDLKPAARLIIEISGGTDRKPAFSVVVDGADVDGKPQLERIEGSQFDWRYGRGAATTQRIFSRIDRLRTEGLMGIFRISAKTPDWTRLDINALMPIVAGVYLIDKQDALTALINDDDRFNCTYGIPMVSATDPNYAPSENAAIRPFWLTLIGEELYYHVGSQPIADLISRLMHAQIAVLKAEHTFAASYNPETGEPVGQRGSVSGIVPLHLWTLLNPLPEHPAPPESAPEVELPTEPTEETPDTIPPTESDTDPDAM